MSVCRILVVDDHRDSTDSMAMLLQMMGHEVHSTYDGSTAIRLAKEFQPDIVLLDLAMPGLDGLAVARAIRKAEAGHLIHLVAVTGWGRKEMRNSPARQALMRICSSQWTSRRWKSCLHITAKSRSVSAHPDRFLGRSELQVKPRALCGRLPEPLAGAAPRLRNCRTVGAE
jgi:CheY-like chemotaxis protein